jgi:hypothetical protein
MGFRDAMNPFAKPDFSTPGGGARSGARIGSAFGPIGMGIGALGGWFAGRQAQGRLTDLGNKGADMQQSWNDRRGAAMWGSSSTPMSQFAGIGAGVDPANGGDTITDDLGITDYGEGGGGAGTGVEIGHGGGGGPMGMQYSAAGGGSGGGVWQGGGGMHSYVVNSPSLSASNYSGIDSGQGRKRGTSPNT